MGHDGTLMLADTDAVIRRGEKVLVKGDSGAGKSTLIRAMAGLWPWGSGRILRDKWRNQTARLKKGGIAKQWKQSHNDRPQADQNY